MGFEDTFAQSVPFWKTFWFWGGAFALGAFCLLMNSMIVITRQQTANVVETFGQYSNIKSAGLTFKAPWPFQAVAGWMNLRIQELGQEISVKSADNAFLLVPVKIQYKVMASKVKEAFYELDNPERQILSYVFNVVRSKANDMDMDEIFQSKDAFEKAVAESLKEQFAKYGYEIVNVLVDDPQPSEVLKAAFDAVLEAKRDQEASELEKIAIRNRTVGKAEAEADSLVLKAKAYVEMRELMAKGNSEAIKLFVEGLDITHAQALHYFEGLDTRDAVRDASRGAGNVVIVPVEGMGGQAGSVAQVAALNKAGVGSNGSSPTPPAS